MGQKIVLSGVTFPDDIGLPILRDDPILSDGSLSLIDVGHSLGGLGTSGVPANGASIPNVAWQKAAMVIGSGDATSLAGTVESSGITSGIFEVERTPKLGIHGRMAHSTQVADGYWSIKLSTLIRDYLYAHRADHEFYVSSWYKLTRGTLPGAQDSPFHFVANTSNYLFMTDRGAFLPASGAIRTIPSTNDASAPSPSTRYSSGHVSGITGTGPSSTANVLFGLGNNAPFRNTLFWNKLASRVLYRSYIEDLTVSGRTAAEVDAIDYALWQEAFGTGGRFNGDTYTEPSELAGG